MNQTKRRFTYHIIPALTALVCAYIVVYYLIGQGPLSHTDFDSYTRQALAWLSGSTHLPENVSWLELAFFEGHYYVSFPPFPSVVMALLAPFFGGSTPDSLVNTLFGIGTFLLIYRYLMRREYGGFYAAVFALLMTLGSNLFYLSIKGWVWFSAQTQGFFFSVLALYLMQSDKKYAWALSFFSLGIAMACRPFQLLYAPLLLYLLYQKMEDKGFFRKLLRCAPYAAPLIFVGLCMGAYNMIRFRNFFEFGHNYLPEFAADPQFSLSYVPGNIAETFKLPGAQFDGFWPRFNGTLFFLVNPVYVLLAVCLIRRMNKKRWLWLACFAVHVFVTLCHRTMGGWHFGARYLVDMLPFMLVVFEDERVYRTERLSGYAGLPAVLLAAGTVINLWGSIWFYTLQ
jgi:hypothetical protein